METPISHYPPVGVRMRPEHKNWLKEKAEEQDRSMNYVVLRIIEEAMERDGKNIQK